MSLRDYRRSYRIEFLPNTLLNVFLLVHLSICAPKELHCWAIRRIRSSNLSLFLHRFVIRPRTKQTR